MSAYLKLFLAASLLLVSDVFANKVPLRHYSIASGLPHENVNTISQSVDGRLWIGTSAGLSYYTGIAFVDIQFQGAVGPVDIVEILPQPDGLVWIATRHQGIWQVRHRNAIQRYSDVAHVQAQRMTSHNGQVYVFARDEMWTIDPATNESNRLQYQYPIQEGYPPLRSGDPRGSGVTDADISPYGEIWVVDARLGPGVLQPDGHVAFLPVEEGSTNNEWGEIRFDELGGLWVTHEGMGLFEIDQTTGNLHLRLAGEGIDHICITPRVIGVASEEMGALYWDLINKTALPALNEEKGLPSNQVNCLFRDDEGIVWIGTEVGLIQMTNPGVMQFTSVENRPMQRLTGMISSPDGGIWTLSRTDGPIQLSPVQTSASYRNAGQWHKLIDGLDGRAYALSDQAWYVYDAGWKAQQVSYGATDGFVDADGTGYFRHDNGLFKYAPGGQVTLLFEWEIKEKDYHFHTLTSDGRLLLWQKGQVVELDKNTAKIIAELGYVEDYQHLQVNELLADSDGRLWVSSVSHGLLCIEPNKTVPLLPGRQLSGLALSGDSLLFAYANDGMYAFRLPHVDETGDQHMLELEHHLTMEDGLYASIVTGAILADNALWMAHAAGVTRVPENVLNQTLPAPKLLLTDIMYSGIAVPPERGPQLSANDTNIGFAYSAPTFARPHQINYQYRLVGMNDQWQDTKRNSVLFTDLPAGDYTFEVQAARSPHQMSDVVSYNFYIPPPFHANPFFWMALTVLFMMLTYTVYRYRLRSILRLQQTRAQIAMDLHDDIGGSLSSLSFLSTLVQNRAKEEAPQEELSPILDEIQQTSGKLMHSMKDIVWAVDPKQDTMGSLLDRLEQFAFRLAGNGGFEFILDAQNHVRELNMTPQGRRNLYLILKEAITNAAKHSNCTRVKLTVNRISNGLQLHLQDNGKGFDTEAMHEGYGCRTMRSRADQSGAAFQIESSPETGTTISLHWPLKPSIDRPA